MEWIDEINTSHYEEHGEVEIDPDCGIIYIIFYIISNYHIYD